MHLVLIAYGWSESSAFLRGLREALVSQLDPREYIVHVCQSNWNFTDYLVDIPTAGDKLSAELLGLYRKYKDVTHLTTVGIGVGGLYLRQALPVFMKPYPEINYKHFITIATPHLGIWDNTSCLFKFWFNWCMGMLGLQLMIYDDGMQLLAMVSPDYINALGVFGQRHAYGSLESATGVSFYSCCLGSVPRIGGAVIHGGTPVTEGDLASEDAVSTMRRRLLTHSWRFVQCNLADFFKGTDVVWRGYEIEQDLVKAIKS